MPKTFLRTASFCSGIAAPDRRRNDVIAAEMYALYQSGESLSEVGAAFGRTRQCVFDYFASRGWKMRERKFLPFVLFNGEKYTPTAKGYYRCTVGRGGDAKLLHREVWKDHHGSDIPEGHDIHHQDENKANNDASNLECLPKPDHTRLYSPHNNQYTRGMKRRNFEAKNCLYCCRTLSPHRDKSHKESPSAFSKRRFCNPSCGSAFLKGKPRGTRA